MRQVHDLRDQLPGGGGVGKPHERDPELVRADVENGYVATGAARDLYGVVLHPIDRSVDLAATHSLRKQKAAPAGR